MLKTSHMDVVMFYKSISFATECKKISKDWFDMTGIKLYVFHEEMGSMEWKHKCVCSVEWYEMKS